MDKMTKSDLWASTVGSLLSEGSPLSRHMPRLRALKEILTVLRDQEIQRMKELVRRESEIYECIPKAKSDEVFQMFFPNHVCLVRLSEIRRLAIWAAFNRLEQGRYGLCEQWGTEISIARLRADPMVQCCVSCGEDGRTYDP